MNQRIKALEKRVEELEEIVAHLQLLTGHIELVNPPNVVEEDDLSFSMELEED